VILGAALADPARAAQLHDPAALGSGAFYLGIILAVAILSVVGGHTHWALRRQVFEARHIGRYRLKEPLGAGGMGEVWAAWHTGLKREVALKILRPDVQQSSAVQRFEREVAATADLTHPNTVRVFDYGVTEDGLWYYAMERLEGETLRGLVNRVGPLEPARCVHLVVQAARALAEAHGKGIIHRDIKPDNLFVTRAGGEPDFIKVLDFGIAALINPGPDGSITTTGAIPGTPAYMAPEVISGQRGSPASDVYALGAVMYYALTGAPPFEGDNWAGTMLAHVQQLPPRPSERRGQPVPEALEDLVMRCLAKEPEQRPADAGALAAALGELGHLSEVSQDSTWGRTRAR
jgi:serine/threonine-protein kinase